MGTNEEPQPDGWHHNSRQMRWEGWSRGRCVCWFTDELVVTVPRSEPARDHLREAGERGRLLDNLLTHIEAEDKAERHAEP